MAAPKSGGAQGVAAGSHERRKTTEEKFQQSLDRIGAAGVDRAKLNAERAVIAQLDIDLQKQFKETETKIAGLPEVIKQRHRDFVKKYAENMATLKAGLDEVEEAKTDAETKAATEKVKAFLEKTRTPKKHVPLDPNNLPFSVRKAKKSREPRLKKEEFEKDFPQQKHKDVKTALLPQRSQRTAGNPQDIVAADLRRSAQILDAVGFKSAIRNPQSEITHKPVLLAYNDIASDVPFQLPRTAVAKGGSNLWTEATALPSLYADMVGSLQNSERRALNLALASAPAAPTADDLAETPDIQFTDAVRAKAQELGNNPVKIYE